MRDRNRDHDVMMVVMVVTPVVVMMVMVVMMGSGDDDLRQPERFTARVFLLRLKRSRGVRNGVQKLRERLRRLEGPRVARSIRRG